MFRRSREWGARLLHRDDSFCRWRVMLKTSRRHGRTHVMENSICFNAPRKFVFSGQTARHAVLLMDTRGSARKPRKGFSHVRFSLCMRFPWLDRDIGNSRRDFRWRIILRNVRLSLRPLPSRLYTFHREFSAVRRIKIFISMLRYLYSRIYGEASHLKS